VIITLAVGADKAEKVTTRYEPATARSTDNERFQREYDLHYNELGRDFAEYVQGVDRSAATSAVLSCCRWGI